jgi:hypothetical protein
VAVPAESFEIFISGASKNHQPPEISAVRAEILHGDSDGFMRISLVLIPVGM